MIKVQPFIGEGNKTIYVVTGTDSHYEAAEAVVRFKKRSSSYIELLYTQDGYIKNGGLYLSGKPSRSRCIAVWHRCHKF